MDDDFVPEVRSGHSMFFYREKLIIFGGMNKVLDEKSDMAILDPVTSKWTQVFAPEKTSLPISNKNPYS